MEKNNKKITKTKKIKKKKNNITTILNNIYRNKKVLLIIIILLILIFYYLYKVIIFIKNPTDTFSVEQGKIYQEETSRGYIIREEVIVKGSNYKNGMVQIKNEGERVAKKDNIFRYFSRGEENLVKKISDLDKKIDVALSKENNILNSDIKSLDKKIEEDIISLVNLNNLQQIKEIKKNINKSIAKKAKIVGNKSPSGSYLKKLIDERSNYEKQLNDGEEYLKAPISGVVSYKVDGYENILTPNNFGNLNKEFLEGLNLKTGELVADSKESGKIINNFKCYITCVLNSKQSQNCKVGDNVKIRLSNNSIVKAKVEYISKEKDENIIVFEIKEQVQGLVSYRKVSVDIIWWSYSGRKVPNIAIGEEEINNNKIKYVVRTRNGYKDKIWIKILKSNEKYSVIENYTDVELQKLGFSAEEIESRKNLTLYDEILKKPT